MNSCYFLKRRYWVHFLAGCGVLLALWCTWRLYDHTTSASAVQHAEPIVTGFLLLSHHIDSNETATPPVPKAKFQLISAPTPYHHAKKRVVQKKRYYTAKKKNGLDISKQA